MRRFRNTFLYRLYHSDKLLFTATLLYFCGLLYGIRFSREEFPFFLYGMYSLKEAPKATYTAYSVVVDGQEIKDTKWLDAHRELMKTPIINFAPQLADSNQDSENRKHEFEDWLWNYVINQKKSPNSVMEVYKYTCAYSATGEPEVLKKELLFNYAEQ